MVPTALTELCLIKLVTPNSLPAPAAPILFVAIAAPTEAAPALAPTLAEPENAKILAWIPVLFFALRITSPDDSTTLSSI